MSLPQAVLLGLAGNKLSEKLTGSSEVSVGRTAVATGSGALLGGIAAGAVTVGAAAVGVAAAPIAVPLAVATAGISFVASLFD